MAIYGRYLQMFTRTLKALRALVQKHPCDARTLLMECNGTMVVTGRGFSLSKRGHEFVSVRDTVRPSQVPLVLVVDIVKVAVISTG